MYAIYGNIYRQSTPNVSIYTIHGSYGYIYIYIYILGRWYISPPNATEIRSSPRIAKCLQCVPEDTHTNLSEDKAGNGAYNI